MYVCRINSISCRGEGRDKELAARTGIRTRFELGNLLHRGLEPREAFFRPAAAIRTWPARDEQDKPYAMRYEAVNAMLFDEFLQDHRRVERLEATVTRLEAMTEKQAAQIQAG